MVALLLGSFNPIHRGHLSIAQYTLDKALADEVWFVVSPQNPLKSPGELAPLSDRLDMVRIAIENHTQMRVCDIEATLPYPSYTINTIRELHKQFPDKEFVILAGSDIKEQLPRWREYRQVERLARFLIYPRGMHSDNCSIEMAEAPMYEIDSTECRRELYPPTPKVLDVLHPDIIDYIHRKRLYAMTEIQLYERGCEYYRNNEFGKALNDFNDALSIDPDYTAARQMKEMVESILNFRHTDIYNP